MIEGRHLKMIMILYKSRYIRRLVLNGRPSGYIVAWSSGSSEREVFRGSLEDLMAAIDDTVKFYGLWRFLI